MRKYTITILIEDECHIISPRNCKEFGLFPSKKKALEFIKANYLNICFGVRLFKEYMESGLYDAPVSSYK